MGIYNFKKEMDDKSVSVTNEQEVPVLSEIEQKDNAEQAKRTEEKKDDEIDSESAKPAEIENNNVANSCETKQALTAIQKDDLSPEEHSKNEVDELDEPKEVPEESEEAPHQAKKAEKRKSSKEQQNNGAISHSLKAGEANSTYNRNSGSIDKITDLIGKETSKLQFLLSQPDIFEYLRKLNNGELERAEESKAGTQDANMDGDHEANANKRHALDGKEDQNSNSKEGYDNDNVIEKIEVQPATLTYGKLRAYQLDALNWLNSLHEAKLNGILADEMGLGKTIESISIMALIESRKTEEERLNRKKFFIVIVPKVTLNKWKKEIKNWFPSCRVFKFYGSQEEKEQMKENELKGRNFDWILTTYEVIMKEKASLQKLKYEYLILDEAHRIKNDQWVLSQVLRKFHTDNRLLLTGTPLQNNLKELWALLNFLMPKLFDSEEEFNELFLNDENDPKSQEKVIRQIHRLLRPFMLRRLKADVEKSLPKKKEIYLYFGMSEMQKKLYKQILSKNIDVVNGAGDRLQLLNVLMQLRKCCNHPYLFDGMEPGPPYEDGPHLYENSMKFKVLDVLLKKLLNKGSKVLIFSQMTRLLDILDDYLRFKGIPYCRIDGQTSAMDRETRIEDFQSPDSDKLVFILSTRAGGLGIDLYAADTVVIFDSDWNPQVDLQAIDRAHRIGQKRDVTVYRFVTEGTVEDVIVRRAARKLKVDHMIMQKGKFGHGSNKKLSTQDMMNAIHCGAQEIIMSKDETMTERDIDKILEYGNEKTDEINQELSKIEQKFNLNNISLTGNENDDGPGMYYFEGEDYKGKQRLDGEIGFIETSRERKPKAGGYDIDQYYRDAFNVPVKDKKRLKGWRALANGGYDHQFFQIERLDELDDKLIKRKEYEEDPEKFDEEPPEFTAKDEEEKQMLLSEGYSNWSKKDFFHYLKLCEKYGRHEHDMILYEMGNKTEEELKEYTEEFWRRWPEMKNGDKYVERIEKSESVIYNDLTKILGCAARRDKKSNSKIIEDEDFTEEEDRFIIRCLYKYGYNNWELMKNEIRNWPRFRFDWNFLSKTTNDLRRRSDYLIDLFKENNAKPKSKPKINRAKSKNSSKAKGSNKPKSEDEIMSSESPSEPVKETKAEIKKPPTPPRNNTRPARSRKSVNYKEA